MNQVPPLPRRAAALLGTLALWACSAPPPAPSAAAVAAAAAADPCVAEHFLIENLVVGGRSCVYSTGRWHLRVEPALPGLALWHDDTRIDTVLQLFPRKPGEPVSSILPALQAQGVIPNDGECILVPAAMGPAPQTVTHYQVRPIGERLRRLEATPKDEIPDPPCGSYGASTHGVRYFIDDPRETRWVVYVDEGQDGTLVNPRSIAWRP
jgi:hypothetical protein